MTGAKEGAGALAAAAQAAGPARLRLPARLLGLLRRDKVAAVFFALLVFLALQRPEALLPVLLEVAASLLSTAPYIAFAVLFISYAAASGLENIIAAALKRRPVPAIFLAALAGGLAPLCSCEVIPLVAALLSAGAPLAPVMAFWLSSPLLDPASAAITLSRLGPVFLAAQAATAVGLGLFGGFALLALARTGFLANPLRASAAPACADSGCAPARRPLLLRFWQEAPRRAVFTGGLGANAVFLVRWLALAYLLAALMRLYVPAEVMARFLGGEGAGSVVLAAALGAPAYLTSYAAPALIAGLMEQGMGRGAGLAFLAAGAVFSIPSATAVFALVRPRIGLLYLALGFAGAVVAGILFA